jgi:hypothetical protein
MVWVSKSNRNVPDVFASSTWRVSGVFPPATWVVEHCTTGGVVGGFMPGVG